MNYTNIYNNLINKRIEKILDKGERHHILPKSMGGSNQKENIVTLTPREHFIAHRLLFKMHKNREMAYALNLMCNTSNSHQSRLRLSSRKYQAIRETYISSISGENSPNYGRVLTEEEKQNISAKVSESLRGNKRALGFKHTQEHKDKMSKMFKGRKRTEDEKHRIKINQPNIKIIVITDANGNSREFVSSSEASKELSINSSNVRMWCRKKHTITRGLNKGLKFEYKN